VNSGADGEGQAFRWLNLSEGAVGLPELHPGYHRALPRELLRERACSGGCPGRRRMSRRKLGQHHLLDDQQVQPLPSQNDGMPAAFTYRSAC
jgi:hypothetical protein